MLLGAVIFVVSLFYLVNWNDDDIRFYAMNIISMTMSIFSAVLMFQGINEQIRRFSENLTHAHRVLIQFLHSFVYLIAMQLVIGSISGVLPMLAEKEEPGHGGFDEEKWTIADGLRSDYCAVLDKDQAEYVRNKNGKKSVWIDEFGVEVPVAKQKHKLEIARRRMRCWAMLLAHMSGFAAINSGAQLQEVEVFSATPLMAVLPGIIMFFILQGVFFLARVFRQKAMDRSDKLRVGLCNETVVEAENDVSSLSLSFLVVQALRFAVGGVLPNAEGEEVPLVTHGWKEIGILFALAVFLCFSAIVLSLKLMKGDTTEEDNEEEEPLSDRMGQILCNFLAMSFAWLVLFGSKWVVLKTAVFNFETMIGQVVMALVLSIVCGLAVFLLDFIDDQTRGNGKNDGAKAIRVIIQAIAILIGFSWEHCFDAGVLAATKSAPHKRAAKFVMGLVVFFFLVPAWRRHILTKVMAYEEMKKQRAHVSKKSARNSKREKIKYGLLAEATASPRELQITAEVKPPAGGGGDYLAPPKNETVKVWGLEGTSEWVWATYRGKGGLLPKSAVEQK